MEIIKHSLHEHLLSLMGQKNREDKVKCKACDEYCDEGVMIYSCRESDCRGFKLHESCANLPQELHNPLLHPHPLSLLNPQDGRYEECNACCNTCRGFIFRCDKCENFNLDVKCALIRPAAIEEGEEEAEAVVVGTHHFTHPHEHPLLLLENMPADRFRCRVCGGWCSDPKTYGCLPCGFFLHPSCFKLPQEIVHPFHPDHGPLTLKPIKDPLTLKRIKDGHVKCNACRHYIYRGSFAYFCEECDFNLDVECTLIRPVAIEEGEEEAEAIVVGTHHFTHPEHPLLLFHNIPAQRFFCRVCREYTCSDPMSYGCLPCGFFLHPSCFNLPQEIVHPFHPYHPLTLKPIENIQRCNACRNYIYRDKYFGCFAYFCEHCNYTKTSFCLDSKCASVIMPAITYEGHDHLLQFKEIIDRRIELHCNACNKSSYESYAFSCLDPDCGIDFHHTCGPLPYTIKHKSHIHPLILTTSPLEDEEDCEPDEFYCDACEEQRVDPFLLPIYYCKECHFVAELKCVISEVVSSLNGECEDVELRNPFGQFGKVITKDTAKEMIQKKDKKQLEPTLTWGNYFRTLSEDEEKEKNLVTDRIKETITAEKIEAYDHEKIIMFSDKAYTQFMKFLSHSGLSNDKFRYPWDHSDLANNREAVVSVWDYMTTRKLSPILNHLLSNHGDIGAQSTLSTPKFKSLYVCMLCKCIYHMSNTMVVDITHDILLDWWTCLKILRLEGFQIDFVFDRLKRVTHAHFGLYVEKEVDSALHQLDRDIERLEALKSKHERIKSAKSTKSKIIEECLRDASELGKGKAVTARLL